MTTQLKNDAPALLLLKNAIDGIQDDVGHIAHCAHILLNAAQSGNPLPLDKQIDLLQQIKDTTKNIGC